MLQRRAVDGFVIVPIGIDLRLFQPKRYTFESNLPMKQQFDFFDRLQVRLAMSAIGHSTLRSQGAPGMVDQARKFLRSLKLQDFCKETREEFLEVLNDQTICLADSFPERGKGNWGAARKALNIFLRDVLYCRPLCERFQLGHIEQWLEVPLDSNVYEGLLCDSENPEKVGRWPGVKKLTFQTSNNLQDVATAIAKTFGVARVHLDVRYWRRAQLDELAH